LVQILAMGLISGGDLVSERSQMQNILSFDIEEHFQVSGLEAAIKREDWDKYPSRVEQNTHVILDILWRNDTKATFFVLGWICQRHPELVKEIASAGHEIACHGFDHKLVYNLTPDEFKDDLKQALDILQQTSGKKVFGYRAPSFSLMATDNEKFEIMAELGFTYDSSFFPMKHFRYGDAVNVSLQPFDINVKGRVLLKEYPMTVVDFLGRRIPAGGGGYFRFYPNFFIKRNFRKANNQGQPVIIYLHPWEFDPEQPRIKGASFANTFRHYHNLGKTEAKLETILKDFKFGPFVPA
jgi:polysaccharide deacetylase family protein (PEP-CTERM system associated)